MQTSELAPEALSRQQKEARGPVLQEYNQDLVCSPDHSIIPTLANKLSLWSTEW